MTEEVEMEEYFNTTTEVLVRKPSSSRSIGQEMDEQLADHQILDQSVTFRVDPPDSSRKSFKSKRPSSLRKSILGPNEESMIQVDEGVFIQEENLDLEKGPAMPAPKMLSNIKPLPSGQVLAKVDSESFQLLQLTGAPLDSLNKFLLFSLDNPSVTYNYF